MSGASAERRELVILGSGTAVPTARRTPSGLILAVGGDVTLVDPGPGALQRACHAGFPAESIRRVLLTHHHPDHCLDVISLLFARKSPSSPPPAHPLEVFGGPGTRGLLERFRDLFGGWITLPEGALTTRELGAGPFALGPSVAGEAFPILHSPASLAYRLTIGGGTAEEFVVALSGDTDVCDGAVEVARGADCYVLEAALPDDAKVDGHLTPRLAAGIGAEARCRHLVLTHFYPEVDVEDARRVAREIFAGRVTIAEDGLRIPLRAVEDVLS